MFGIYKYPDTAIRIHDIMLGTNEELGRGAFGEMYVYLQPAAKPCCSTLPDVRLYLKPH